ncbi:MAG: AMP-binding protein, partial [Acidimicrobiales bacterium]
FRTRHSVGSRLRRLAMYRGNDPAYLDANSGELVTWKAIGNHALDWSDQLKDRSVVALRTGNPAVFCRAYLAALAAGVCVVPIDPRATREEIFKTLDALEISDLVVGPSDTTDLGESGLNTWVSSTGGLAKGRLANGHMATRPPTPKTADVILATSGSSGISKFVPLFESQLLRVATRIARHNELSPEDRGYSPLPLFHVNAQVVGVLANLVSGSSLIVDDRFHRSDFWAACEDYRCTWVNLVPAILGSLADQKPPSRSVSDRIRFARSASAPLSPIVLERFETTCGIGILETYGMTEAASQIAANPMRADRRRTGSVGLPLGVTVRITDANGQAVDIGETGIVKIGGPDVTKWYIEKGRSRVAALDSDGYLRTGDIGWRDADGFLYLEGREDDVINRGGEKISPREVENLLLRDPAVASVAVVGRPHPILGAEVVAYIETRDHMSNEEVAKLRQHLLAECERLLSPHKRPAGLFAVHKLPTTQTGKVLRRKIDPMVPSDQNEGKAS